MRCQASPEICDIFMCTLEEPFIQSEPHILKWLRYRDYILLLYEGNRDELNNMVVRLNSTHPLIQFTAEVSENEVTYLDLTIFKGEGFRTTGILDSKVYTKATESFQYLDRNSAHPRATFNGFLKGEMLRYARLCSNETDLIEKMNSFQEKLLLRNYTREECVTVASNVRHEHRELYVNSNDNRRT